MYIRIECPTHGKLAEVIGEQSIVWCHKCKTWFGQEGKVDNRRRRPITQDQSTKKE